MTSKEHQRCMLTASFPTGQGLHTDASGQNGCSGAIMIVAAEGNAYVRSHSSGIKVPSAALATPRIHRPVPQCPATVSPFPAASEPSVRSARASCSKPPPPATGSQRRPPPSSRRHPLGRRAAGAPCQRPTGWGLSHTSSGGCSWPR